HAGATTVFTFQVTAGGSYTFTLDAHLDHASGSGENNLLIDLGAVVTATDSDGDAVTAPAAGLVITVVDDVPVATATVLTGTVDEDGLPAGIAAGDGGNISQTIATGSVSTLFSSG